MVYCSIRVRVFALTMRHPLVPLAFVHIPPVRLEFPKSVSPPDSKLPLVEEGEEKEYRSGIRCWECDMNPIQN